MTGTDLLFAAAVLVSTLGFVTLVAAVILLVARLLAEEEEPPPPIRAPAPPRHFRVRRRPFDWAAYPDL